jgi:hypothetical protein
MAGTKSYSKLKGLRAGSRLAGAMEQRILVARTGNILPEQGIIWRRADDVRLQMRLGSLS